MDTFWSSVTTLMGHWTGVGRWAQEDGTTADYAVALRFHSDHLAFTHRFSDAADVEARFDLVPLTGSILHLEVDHTPIGKGYVSGAGTFRYTLVLPTTVVETGYHLAGGQLHVTGCSTENEAGQFIMWEERLSRPG